MNRISFAVLTLLIVIVGCRKKVIETDHIDSTVELWISERLHGENRVLELIFTTEKNYPYSHYYIDHNFKFKENKNSIEFELIQILESGVHPISGPAVAAREIENIANGTYDFSVSINDIPHMGQLIVTEGFFNLEFEDSEALTVPLITRNRVPKNTIWGEVTYYADENLESAEAFIETLINAGAIEKTYNTGNYWDYIIEEDGNIKQPSGNAIAFIFGYENNTNKIEAVIRSYRVNHPELHIRVKNDFGESF